MPADPHTLKQFEDELQRQLSLTSAVISSLGEGVCAVDVEGCLTFINPAAEQTLGWTQAELLGRQMHEVVRCRQADGAPPWTEECPLLEVSHSGTTYHSDDGIFARKDGTALPVACTSTPIVSNGTLSGAVVAFHDITERKRHERRLGAQYAVSRVLAESTNLATALHKILYTISAGLEWDYGALWTVDERDGLLRCVATRNVKLAGASEFDALNRRSTYARGRGLPGRAWASGGPVWVRDLAMGAGLARRDLAAAAGLHTCLEYPIRIGSNVIGVLEFFSRGVRQPDRHAIEVMRALGGQIGQFIERKRAEEELRIRTRQQAAVAELGKQALTCPGLTALMDEAVALVAQTLDVEYSKVLELLPQGSALLLRSGVGWKEGLVGRALVSAGPDSPLHAGRAQPASVEEHPTETPVGESRLLREHGVVGGGISVVIQGQEGPFGVLSAHTTRTRTFTEDDVHFVQVIANMLGAALQRESLERRLAEDRFRLLVQHSSDITMIVEPDGTVRYVSPSIERILGYSPEDLLGTNGFDLMHPDDVARLLGRRTEALMVPGTTISTELRSRHRDGSWRYLEVIGSNFLHDPRINGLVFNSRDITERRELAITQERTRIAREMHDSVAQVLGYVNTKAQAAQKLLRRKQVDLAATQLEQLAEAARIAYADVREDILGLRNSLDTGQDLLAALREYLVSWQAQSGVWAEMVVPDGFNHQLSPTAELQLLRIIQEALANVRKHSGATNARVSFCQRAGQVEVVVEDDGKGFDTLEPGRSEFPRFGLAMMRERAETVRGRLEIHSAPGDGTRVLVSLPADMMISVDAGGPRARVDEQ